MLVVNDALDAILLGSFLFGLVFTGLSLVLGFADVDIDGDLFGGGGDADGDGGGLINLSTILAFVAWFGGVGYLVRHGLGWGAVPSVGLGILGGVGGAAAIAWFMAKVVRPNDKALDPDDFRLPGTMARVTSSIRAGGIGEILFEQQGIRQVAAARAQDGRAIPRETEVVVLSVDHGIAKVEPWDSLMAPRETGRPTGELARVPAGAPTGEPAGEPTTPTWTMRTSGPPGSSNGTGTPPGPV